MSPLVRRSLPALLAALPGFLGASLATAGPILFEHTPPYLNQAIPAGEESHRIALSEISPRDNDEEPIARALLYSGKMRYEDGEQGGSFSAAYLQVDDELRGIDGTGLNLSVSGEFYLGGDYGLMGFVTIPFGWTSLRQNAPAPANLRRETRTLSSGLLGGFMWPLPMGSISSITPFVRFGGYFGVHYTDYDQNGIDSETAEFSHSELAYGIDLVLAKLALSGYVVDSGGEQRTVLQVGIEF